MCPIILKTIYLSKENDISNRYWKFQRKILSSFKDIARYKFTKVRWDNGELPVISPSA